MSVYNGESWLEESIRSILAQTFTDFEFIIVNDGSTDKSISILHDLAAKDSRIRLFSKSNTGLTDSLNFGIERARGEWIARIDADDISFPERLEIQYKLAKSDPDIVLVGGGLTKIDMQGQEIKTYSYPISHVKLVNNLKKGSRFFAHSCAFIKTFSIREIGGYRMRLKRAQDLDLWLRLSQTGKIAAVDKTIIKLRVHPQQISHDEGGRRQKIDAFVARISFVLIKQKETDPVSAPELEFQKFRLWLVSKLESDGYFEYIANITKMREYTRCNSLRKLLMLVLRIILRPRILAFFIVHRFFTKQYSGRVAKSWLKYNIV